MDRNHEVTILDASDVRRALTRISHEIIERNKGSKGVVTLGIRRRGGPMAARLARIIETIDGNSVPWGMLDARAHRDDVAQRGVPDRIETEIPVDLTDRIVILVDEVIYTGRTARAAMDALLDFGRPRAVQLAVLIDRGHRELPISPNFVGRNIPTSRFERVHVHLSEVDGEDRVFIVRPGLSEAEGPALSEVQGNPHA